jgi:hypothetical protein
MSKIEFIYYLVSHNFASQYEAEQYTLAAGSGEWAYYNPFTRYKANTNVPFPEYYPNDIGIVLYKYNQFEDNYYSHQIFCKQREAA